MRNIPIKWSAEHHRNLNYNFNDTKDPVQTQYWANAGLPYNNLIVGIHQLLELYPWMQYLCDYFDHLSGISFCFHKMLPGYYLPAHQDSYNFYKKKHNITDLDQIERSVIFLEDGDHGHILTVDDVAYYKWRTGDCVSWQGTTTHSAINVGTTDRYTLTVTGYISD